jgi:diguanylate cyclase (GGDEF)-like protein
MEQKKNSSWIEPLFSSISSRKYTLFLTILILVTLVFSGIGLLIHRSVQRLLIEELRYASINTAVTAASFIEGEIEPYEAFTEAESYTEGLYDADYYQKMQKTFRTIKEETNLGFIYSMKKVSDETVMYLLDGEDPLSAFFSPLGSTEKMDSYMREVLSEKAPVSTNLIHWEGWGDYISGLAPIMNRSGTVIGFVGVDIGTETIVQMMEQVDRVIRAVALFVIILVTFYTYKIVEDRSTAYNEDYLTKLYSRRHHDRQLDMHIRRLNRKGGELSIMMIDVDDFKTINDFYGHEAGDKMLKYVAGVIRKNLRKTDISSRIGGDEFNIILPGTSLEDTQKVALRIIHDLESRQDDHKVSVSIGVAKWEKSMDSSILTKMADQAMYKAKESGRNQVQVVGEYC